MDLQILLLVLFCVFSTFSFVQGAGTLVASVKPVKAGQPGAPRVSVQVGTPPQTQLLELDLEADIPWFPCNDKPASFKLNKSSTFTTIRCSSKVCSTGCSSSSGSKQCSVPLSNTTSISLFKDVLTLNTTDGKTALIKGKPAFGCADKRPVGVAALSKHRLSLPHRIATLQNIPFKFTMCLSPDSPSALFFGDDSSFIISGINVSNYVQFVPLLSSSFFPSRYYLAVQTIHTDFSKLQLDPSLFSIDASTGTGGLKLDTKSRYTKLPTPAYAALVETFKNYASTFNISTVPSVSPLQLCFDASTFNYNRIGPVVPVIDLVLQSGVTWSLPGANTIELFNVNNKTVGCLAFQDAGPPPVTSSIGLFQMFDNLLHFDLRQSRFGFVDRSLHLLRTSCKFVATSA